MSKNRYHHHIATGQGIADEEERQRIVDDLEFDLDTLIERRRALEEGEARLSADNKEKLRDIKNRIGDLERSIRNLKQGL